MASACVTEAGDCLRDLGRLAEAAQAYEEAVRRNAALGNERGIAVGQAQLGTVRLAQRRFPEALQAHADARDHFTRLGEPGSVAVSWHQSGMAYQSDGQAEAAEQAYRKSLAIQVQLKNIAGQANTFNQLGTLYDDVLDHPEEAVGFYRQAAACAAEIEYIAGEGRARSNLAETLRKLRRIDEARQEIRRAIQCGELSDHAAALWKTWAILAGIEADCGKPEAAAQARAKGRAAYLAYRRDGGENHDGAGRIAHDLAQQLLAGDQAGAAEVVHQLNAVANPPPWLPPFATALQAIIAGSRDPALADAPDLSYDTAAELRLLIETLSQPR